MRQIRIAAREVARKTVAGDLDLANMKREDRGDYLAGGVPASLSRAADTAEAQSLVKALGESMEAHHLQSGRWKYRRGPAAQERLLRALAGFVGDLLAAPGAGRWGGLVWQSTHNKAFSGGPVSGDLFRDMQAYLLAAELIEHFPGYRTRKDYGGGFVAEGGQAARYRATPGLLALAEAHSVLAGYADDHFVLPPLPPLPKDTPLVALKSASVRREGTKFRGEPMPVPDTPEVRRITAQLVVIRDFLAGVTIEGGVHRGFVRQFAEGDHPAFAWDRGGRLYSVGTSYQQLKGDERLAMRLNGEPVVEIDITASHLTLLHGLTQTTLDVTQDPYILPGLDRRVVKNWITASFGAGKPLTRWTKEQSDDYAKRNNGRKLGADFKARFVRSAVVQRYPVLADFEGVGVGWGRLQYIESEIVVATMLALIAEGVPALPVHDSIIVPGSNAERARTLLTTTFEAHAGIGPRLEVKEAQASMTMS